MPATYSSVISTLERAVRNYDAFPDANTKLAEQIDATFRYISALTKTAPISKLKLELSSPLQSYQDNHGFQVFSLPQDIIEYRGDLGIANFEVVHDSVFHIMTFNELIQVENLRASARNAIQAGNLLLGISIDAKKLYTTSDTSEVKVMYAKKPVKPSEGAYASHEINLDDNTIEVLIEALASQFTSVNARDLSASQIHATLSQIMAE